MSMTTEAVERILQIGLEHDVWEAPAAEMDDAYRAKEAQELVDGVAVPSYKKGSVNDPVLEILFLGGAPESDFPEAYEWARANGRLNGGAPTKPEEARSVDALKKQADDGKLEIESVYPGYDEQKVGQIVAAILESAADGELTEEEFKVILAYEEANEGRTKILELKPEFKAPEPPPVTTATSKSVTVDPAATTASVDYADPAAFEQAYENGTLGDDRVRQENLPIPPAYTGPEPVVPIDITEASDQGLSRLMMTFDSLEARGLRLVSLEEGRARAATEMLHDAMRDATALAFGRAQAGGLDMSKSTHVDNARAQAKVEAESDPNVVKWRTRKRRHEAEARNLQALVTGWGNKCARLSREQSRRENLGGGRSGR